MRPCNCGGNFASDTITDHLGITYPVGEEHCQRCGSTPYEAAKHHEMLRATVPLDMDLLRAVTRNLRRDGERLRQGKPHF
jgi:hypothetical protein